MVSYSVLDEVWSYLLCYSLIRFSMISWSGLISYGLVLFHTNWFDCIESGIVFYGLV